MFYECDVKPLPGEKARKHMQYTNSPKAIVIAGAPASGKSTVAHRIRDEFGYSFLSLDSANSNYQAWN